MLLRGVAGKGEGRGRVGETLRAQLLMGIRREWGLMKREGERRGPRGRGHAREGSKRAKKKGTGREWVAKRWDRVAGQ